MKEIAFLIPGLPIPKKRVPGGSKFAFTPKASVVYENLVRTSFSDKYPDYEPTDEPMYLYATFRFPIPQSAKRTKIPDKIKDGDPFTNRPDLDNLVKSVLDGLNQVAYVDDKSIVGIFAIKRYGKVPGAYVSLRPAPEALEMIRRQL